MRKKVLITDDSRLMRTLLSDLIKELNFDIDEAANGKEAVQKATNTQYDIITMDITMPVMDGITAVKEIMNTNPTPILMVSSLTTEDADVTIESLKNGAVDYISKPRVSDFENSDINKEILLKIKHISSIPKSQLRASARTMAPSTPISSSIQTQIKNGGEIKKVVLIGSSTGGPGLIEELCSKIPINYPYPICIIQHMPASFTKSFASRLSRLGPLPTHEIVDGMEFLPGNIYIAKGGSHLDFSKNISGAVSLRVYQKFNENLFLPSIDEIFKSSLNVFRGNQILAVLLTGIGKDGAEGMLSIKNAGGMTIGENEESAQVYGMPKAAYEIGAVKK